MKKTLAKILALALCAILLVTGTVFVTLAYLTAKTDVVRNTFTSANVYLKLDEAKTNAAGQPLDAEGNVVTDFDSAYRITTGGNEYHLVPGSTYTKDPTVTVTYGGTEAAKIKSEPCYVFIAVYNTMFPANNGIEESQNSTTIAKQMENNGWAELSGASLTDATARAALVGDANPAEGDIKIYYIKASAAGDSIATKGVGTDGVVIMNADCEEIVLPIFESFTIDSDVPEIDATDRVLNIIAFAVQSEGMDSAQEAWTSTYGQSTAT